MRVNKNKGFTLLELLVVIAIIGILATIVMVSLSSAKARGRDARRVGDIKQLQQALENYFENNSSYPPSLSNSNFLSLLNGNPVDPSTGASYGYAVQASPAAYCVGVNFEKGRPANVSPSENCLAGYSYSISSGNFATSGGNIGGGPGGVGSSPPIGPGVN